MRILSTGLILLAVASTVACASEVADGDLGGTGGTTGTGGAVSGVGGSVAGTGGSVAGTGGSVAGIGGSVAGTGGSTGTPKVDCAAGTTVQASETPTLIAWDVQTGAARTDDTTTPITGPLSLTTVAGASGPYLAAVLSSWVDPATGGRACVDVSAYKGVKFTISATTPDLVFKVGVSKADFSGSCAVEADCSAHPYKILTPSASATEVTVLFSELLAPEWGVMAAFDATEVVSLIWASDDKLGGKNITVSNVTFVPN